MVEKGKHSRVFLLGGIAVKRFNRGFLPNAKKELAYLRALKPHGIAPRPYFRIGRFLVMSRVRGRPVRELSPGEIKATAPDFLRALCLLDKLGIKKEESHRPLKHFFKTDDGIKLIDFERAHSGAGNVTQFLTFLERYYKGISGLGRQYKKDGDVEKIISFIASSGR